MPATELRRYTETTITFKVEGEEAIQARGFTFAPQTLQFLVRDGGVVFVTVYGKKLKKDGTPGVAEGKETYFYWERDRWPAWVDDAIAEALKS